MSDADERKIGDEVSLKLREHFGVFQDKAVTTYVSLVGTVLAQGQHAPEPELAVHRARHGRRERLRGARRHRAYHARVCSA